MKFHRTCKFCSLIEPVKLGRFASVGQGVNCSGFLSAIWITTFGKVNGLSPENSVSICKLEESDNNVQWADIPECTLGNSACVDVNGNAMPLTIVGTSGTGPAVNMRFDLNLLKRKKYIRMSVAKNNDAVVASALVLGDSSSMGEISNSTLVQTITSQKPSVYIPFAQSDIG